MSTQDTGKLRYIFCPPTSLAVKLFSPFLSSFSFSLLFTQLIDSLQAEEKLLPITALQHLSVGNRGPSSQDCATNSYHNHNSTKY